MGLIKKGGALEHQFLRKGTRHQIQYPVIVQWGMELGSHQDRSDALINEQLKTS
jgi:hypothetical protein